MNILRALRHEEKKLIQKSDTIQHQVRSVREAINALDGYGSNGASPKKRGMSNAHRKAISEGIRKSRLQKAKHTK